MWVHTGGVQKVEIEFGLRDEAVSFCDGEVGVNCGQARHKMILPRADSLLGGIAAVDVRRHELVLHLLGVQHMLEQGRLSIGLFLPPVIAKDIGGLLYDSVPKLFRTDWYP